MVGWLGMSFGVLLAMLLAVLPTACSGRADGRRSDGTVVAGSGGPGGVADSVAAPGNPGAFAGPAVSENPVGPAGSFGIPLLENFLLANPPAENPAAEPLFGEELAAKRAANLRMADYLWRDGMVIRLALTAEEAAALGISARHYAEALEEIAQTNRIIREHLSLGDTVPMDIPERPRKSFPGK